MSDELKSKLLAESDHQMDASTTSVTSSGSKFVQVRNFRDISQIIPTIRPGRIYRSATPSEATNEDLDILIRELRIKTIIDFRDRKEAARDPGERTILTKYSQVDLTQSIHPSMLGPYMEDDMAMRTLGFPERRLLRAPYARRKVMTKAIFDEMSCWDTCQVFCLGCFCMCGRAKKKMLCHFNQIGLLGLYKIILQRSSSEIVNVLRACADSSNYPIMLHCSHGKDRTGLTVALIEAAVGIPLHMIVADYELSDEYANSEMGRHRFELEAPDLDLDEWSRAKGETIRQLFEWVDEQYGSVHGYLNHIGFGEYWQDKLAKNICGDLQISSERSSQLE